MLSIQTASPHPVTHIVFSPSGGTFAVAQPNSGITICDRVSGQPTATLTVPRAGQFTSVVFCDGGAKLAMSSHKGVHLFDTATGQALGRRGSVALSNGMLAVRGTELIGVTSGHVWDIPVEGAAWPVSRLLRSQATVVAVSPCGQWGFGVYGHVRPSLLNLGTGRVAFAVKHPF